MWALHFLVWPDQLKHQIGCRIWTLREWDFVWSMKPWCFWWNLCVTRCLETEMLRQLAETQFRKWNRELELLVGTLRMSCTFQQLQCDMTSLNELKLRKYTKLICLMICFPSCSRPPVWARLQQGLIWWLSAGAMLFILDWAVINTLTPGSNTGNFLGSF